MSASKIEQLIEDIFDFVENSKTSFANPGKVVIHKEELFDIMHELRRSVPEEIKQYQKVISNRNNIYEDAKRKAADMLAQANEQANAIVNESEVVRLANQKAQEIVDAAVVEANRIVDQANAEASQIRVGSLTYTNELLNNVESIIQNAFKNTKSRYDLVFSALKEDLDVIAANKKEIEMSLPKNVTPASQPKETPVVDPREVSDMMENEPQKGSNVSEDLDDLTD